MEEETHILVTHGKDPLRVKKEMTEDDDLTFFSIIETIDLTESDGEEDAGGGGGGGRARDDDGAGGGAGGGGGGGGSSGRLRFEKVRLSLAWPSASEKPPLAAAAPEAVLEAAPEGGDVGGSANSVAGS
eukprot:7380884-Prymnesium_polylepis.1